MANYNLYAIKEGNLVNISDVTYDIKELREIDRLTRKYRNEQELLEYFSNEGRMLFKPPFDGVKILYAQGGKMNPIDPLFKESVSNNGEKDVYTQTLEFAEVIGQIYSLCVRHIGKGFTTNYKRIREFLEKSNTLKNPEFNIFMRNIFSTPGVFGCINKDGKMPFEKYLKYIDTFYELYDPNTDSIDSPYKEKILDNYYNAILLGFYKKFYKDDNFNYRGFRDYYCTYYETYYLNNENNKNISLADDNNGVSRTIEEVYEDDYFPDERRNDNSIMRDEDGGYYFKEDISKTK